MKKAFFEKDKLSIGATYLTNKESGKQLKIQTNKQQYIDNDTNKYTDKTRTNCPKDQST